MNSGPSSERLAFSRHWPGAILGIAFACIGLIGLGLAASPRSGSDRPFGFALMVACAWLSYRGFRGATVTIDRTGLRVHGLLRTHRWPLVQVRGVSVVVGQVGLYERAFIRIELAGRRPFLFSQFNSPPRSRAELDQIASELNAFLSDAWAPHPD